jgi:hypothetical protein
MLEAAQAFHGSDPLTGGIPRRAGKYVEEVRALRRAMGYDAEHVVNGAFLAWVGAPRAQIEAIATATGDAGWGGVQASTLAALPVRELAEGRYRDAYESLFPALRNPADRHKARRLHPRGVPLRLSPTPSSRRSPGPCGSGTPSPHPATGCGSHLANRSR